MSGKVHTNTGVINSLTHTHTDLTGEHTWSFTFCLMTAPLLSPSLPLFLSLH